MQVELSTVGFDATFTKFSALRSGNGMMAKRKFQMKKSFALAHRESVSQSYRHEHIHASHERFVSLAERIPKPCLEKGFPPSQRETVNGVAQWEDYFQIRLYDNVVNACNSINHHTTEGK